MVNPTSSPSSTNDPIGHGISNSSYIAAASIGSVLGFVGNETTSCSLLPHVAFLTSPPHHHQVYGMCGTCFGTFHGIKKKYLHAVDEKLM